MSEIRDDLRIAQLDASAAFKGSAKIGKDLGFGRSSVAFMGNVDIYRDYRWGVTGKDQPYLDEVPIVILTEYQPNSSPVLEELAYTVQVLGGIKSSLDKNITTNPYLKMYSGTVTGNIFHLPFFSPYNHTINSSWGEPDEKGKQAKARDIFSKYSGGLFQRGSIEKRKVWKGSSASAYSFTFTLYNTFQPQEDIIKNIQFIRTLTTNTLATRTSYASILPPCIYKLEIPGVRFAPAVSLDGVDIQNIGQVNRKSLTIPDKLGKSITMDMNIPDAFEITISVAELLTESRELYGQTFSASKVSIIHEQKANDGVNINLTSLGGGSFL